MQAKFWTRQPKWRLQFRLRTAVLLVMLIGLSGIVIQSRFALYVPHLAITITNTGSQDVRNVRMTGYWLWQRPPRGTMPSDVEPMFREALVLPVNMALIQRLPYGGTLGVTFSYTVD